jgi:hypothetical protein
MHLYTLLLDEVRTGAEIIDVPENSTSRSAIS